MDINESLQPVITSLIDSLKLSIEAELQDKISDEVIKKIADTEINTIIERLVEQQILARVEKFDFVNASQEQLSKIVARLTDQINTTLTTSANTQINSYISQKLASIDLTDLVSSLIGNKLTKMLDVGNFPPQSISHTSIDFNGLVLNGDHIKGGIIDQFGSTGIEDRSSFVQLTLMDHASAFEGPVWAPEVKIKGDLHVDGTLIINGDIDINTPVFAKLVDQTSISVKSNLDETLFSNYSDIIFNKITTNGLDLDRITQNGKEIVKGNQLGYHITDTNIQRLGTVRDFQTQGENYLSETLYVSGKRVGINTMDPSTVLSVWDEEVEVVVTKRSQDTAYVGTPRYQSMVLGANGQQNIKLNTDGSIEVDRIKIGSISMSSTSTIPNYQGSKGQIVWNENPSPGSPIGWVCLGGHLWAKFGIIE